MLRKIFLSAVFTVSIALMGGEKSVEQLDIQFASRSDMFAIGQLFVMEDGVTAPRRLLKRSEPDPVPGVGRAVLRYESASLPAPREDGDIGMLVLARRDAVIWRSASSPVTGLTLEEARDIFSGKKGGVNIYTLKNDDVDGAKPALWLLGSVPLAVQRTELSSGKSVELIVDGDPAALGLGIFRGEPASLAVPAPIDRMLPGDEGYPLAGEYRLYFLKQEREQWEHIAEIFRKNLNSDDFAVAYYGELGIFSPQRKNEEAQETEHE